MCFLPPKFTGFLGHRFIFSSFQSRFWRNSSYPIRSWVQLQYMRVNLWSDSSRVAPLQDQPCSPLSSLSVRSSLLCLRLFPYQVTPKDSKKKVKFKLEFSLERIQLLSYSEQLGHCYFGLRWVKPVLVDPSSVACHTSWQKWAHTMSFFSHEFPHFYSLTGFHGSIWIIQLRKKKIYSFLLPLCSPDVQTYPGLWLPAGLPFFFYWLTLRKVGSLRARCWVDLKP